jgi:hypothetical protein
MISDIMECWAILTILDNIDVEELENGILTTKSKRIEELFEMFDRLNVTPEI